MVVKEYLIERCLIRYAFNKYCQDKEPSYSDFAGLIFFDRSDPSTTFKNVRQGKPKPQRITIEEAARMAKSVGTDLASLCFNVQKEIENGWTLKDDFKPEEIPPGPKKRGRASTPLIETTISVPGEAMEASLAQAKPFPHKQKTRKETADGPILAQRNKDYTSIAGK